MGWAILALGYADAGQVDVPQHAAMAASGEQQDVAGNVQDAAARLIA